jgi:hypothetical protein
VKGVAVSIGIVGLIFVLPLITVIGGLFTGWVVGLFFEDMIRSTLADFGIVTDASMAAIGGTLGFVGAFFKSVTNNRTT